MATQVTPTGIQNNSSPIENITLATDGGVDIDSGHLVVTHGGDVTVDSALQGNSTLNITGNTTLGGTLEVTGNTTLDGTLTGAGSASFVDDGVMLGEYLGGDLTVQGDKTRGTTYISPTQVVGYSDADPATNTTWSITNSTGDALFSATTTANRFNVDDGTANRTEPAIYIATDPLSLSGGKTHVFSVLAEGSVYSRGDIYLAGDANSSGGDNIRLSQTGNAEFAGDGHFKCGGADPGHGVQFINDGEVKIWRPTGSGSSVNLISGSAGVGTAVEQFAIKADGSATFAGKISSTISGDDEIAIRCGKSGVGYFGAWENTGTFYLGTNIGADEVESRQVTLSAAGTGAFRGELSAATISSPKGFFGRDFNTGGKSPIIDNTGYYTSVAGITDTGPAYFPHGTSGATGRNLEVYGGIQINTEPDNDDNYTFTTDVDEEGNTVETRVYNGPTLDVTDRLSKADTALQTLKTAAAAAVDFSELKAAIATALADI